MGKFVPLDYSYVVYWQLVKAATIVLLTTCFILPIEGSKYVHPSSYYLVLVCVFTLTSALYYLLLANCFSEYYTHFTLFQLICEECHNFILLLLIPLRNFIVTWYVQNPKSAKYKNTILSIPQFFAFLMLFGIDDFNFYEEDNFATYTIQNNFLYGGVSEPIIFIIIFLINIYQNCTLKKYLINEQNRILKTTDPLELQYLVENYQYKSATKMSVGSISLLRNLTFSRVLGASILYIIAEVLELIKNQYILIFHLSFPIELASYIILFSPQKGKQLPESFFDVLANEVDRKNFLVYIYERQYGLNHFAFLKATAELHSSEELKQDVEEIFYKYFNNVKQNNMFSLEAVLEIREKIVELNELDNKDLYNIFNPAEEEAVEFLDKNVIPDFYRSNIGIKMLCCNYFFDRYTKNGNVFSLDHYQQALINPMVIFSELIDYSDYNSDKFLTQSNKLIETSNALLAFFESSNIPVFNELKIKLRDNVAILNSEYMRLTEFVRHQQSITEAYAEFLKPQIGPRPNTRLVFDEKTIYYDEMHAKQDKPAEQTTSSGRRNETSDETSQSPKEAGNKEYLIELSYEKEMPKYPRFLSLPNVEQSEYIQDIIDLELFQNSDEFDCFDLLREKLDCPLEKVFKTSLVQLGLLETINFAPESIQEFCKLCTVESSKQTYYNINRSMHALQNISNFIYKLQGQFYVKQTNDIVFTREEVIAVLLVCCCSHIEHSGIDDHSVISVEHALSIVFNDRDPNERSAAGNGWNIIVRTGLLSYFDNEDIRQIRQKFIQYLLSFDSKNYTRLKQKLKSTTYSTYSEICNLEKSATRAPQDEQAKFEKELNECYKSINAYTDILLEFFLFLSMYGDSYRKLESFELLSEDLQEQLEYEQKIETFSLQQSYLPEICKNNWYTVPIYQLYIIDHIVLLGLQELFSQLKSYSAAEEYSIPIAFIDYLIELKELAIYTRNHLLQRIDEEQGIKE